MSYIAIAEKHSEMESEFTQICKEKGYDVIDLSYHINFEEGKANMLRRDFSPASVSFRVSPDMLIQKMRDGVFKSAYVELKTGNRKGAIQMEAFQLLHNKVLEKNLRTPCIYVYKGTASGGKMMACYSSEIRVSKLVIPNAQKNNLIRPILLRNYEVPLEERGYIEGFSNDAFVEVTDISNWRPLDVYLN